MPDRFIRKPEVLEKTGIGGTSTLYDWMASGKFPRPVKLGAKIAAWRESEVDAWMEAREREVDAGAEERELRSRARRAGSPYSQLAATTTPVPPRGRSSRPRSPGGPKKHGAA